MHATGQHHFTSPAGGTSSSAVKDGRSELQAVENCSREFGLLLEHSPLAPATAREAARSVLAAWGLDEDQIYSALLVISELVTNAVTHALPPVVLHLQATDDGSGRVQIHISDGGPQAAPSAWAAHRPSDEHGRGAEIVSALSERAGTGHDIDGLIDHWADLNAA
ncbi:ATP-binding protein [Streptomyces sp. 058-1L]|uniref:ATP-binding protein n=1 Tax=Streptomyces sp. 058-1L TaxID=2789266 RepID=UPI00398023E2